MSQIIKIEFLGDLIELESPAEGFIKNYPNDQPVKDTKEERILQATFIRIGERFKYPKDEIRPKVPVQMGTSTREADGVVFDEGMHPYIVIETKSPDIKRGLDQGMSYARSLGAKYVFWTNGTNKAAYNVELEEEISDIPPAYKIGTFQIYGNAKGVPQKPIPDINSARGILKRCHNTLRDIEGKAAFFAFPLVSRLLYTKIWDEMNTKKGEYYTFQAGSGKKIEEVAKGISSAYVGAREKEPIFPPELGIKEDLTLFNIANFLEPYSFLKTDLEIKGEAFQEFLDPMFRGEQGQYFTPRTIVKAMVEMAEPKHKDKILDPFCGSGGFLVYSIHYVERELKRDFDPELFKRHKFEFAHYNLFGLEIEEFIAQTAVSDMLINEDAHSRIYVMDAFRDLKEISERTGITPNSFNLILTNPPLGSYESRRYILSNFELGKKHETRSIQALSVERGLKFLKPTGSLYTIISEDILERDKEVVDFIKPHLRAIISLPLEAFNPYGANSKTNILFLGKSITEENAFMAEVSKVGYDTSGRKIEENELEPTINAWKDWKKGEKKQEEIFSLDPLIFTVNKQRLGSRIDVKHIYLQALEKKISALKQEWISQGFKVKELSELVEPSTQVFKTNPSERYLFVSVHFDGSISPRSRKWEKVKSKYSELFLLKEGDLIISGIDLISGAVSVVPQELDGSVSSKEFIILKVKDPNIPSLYLWQIFRTDYIKALAKGVMTGMTGRHRVKWENIKNFEIPIPPEEHMDLMEELQRYKEYETKAIESLRKVESKLSRLGKIPA